MAWCWCRENDCQSVNIDLSPTGQPSNSLGSRKWAFYRTKVKGGLVVSKFAKTPQATFSSRVGNGFGEWRRWYANILQPLKIIICCVSRAFFHNVILAPQRNPLTSFWGHSWTFHNSFQLLAFVCEGVTETRKPRFRHFPLIRISSLICSCSPFCHALMANFEQL